MTIMKDDASTIIISNYLKRVLEGGYNRFGQSRVGEMLKNQGPAVKYGLEAMLNIMAATLNQRVTTDTLFNRVLVNIGTDAAPELAKRIINGVRDQVNEKFAGEESKLANTVLGLAEEPLGVFLNELAALETTQRQQIIDHLNRYSPKEILLLVQLPAELLGLHAKIFGLKTGEARAKSPSEAIPKRPHRARLFERIESFGKNVETSRLKLQKIKRRKILW